MGAFFNHKKWAFLFFFLSFSGSKVMSNGSDKCVSSLHKSTPVSLHALKRRTKKWAKIEDFIPRCSKTYNKYDAFWATNFLTPFLLHYPVFDECTAVVQLWLSWNIPWLIFSQAAGQGQAGSLYTYFAWWGILIFCHNFPFSFAWHFQIMFPLTCLLSYHITFDWLIFLPTTFSLLVWILLHIQIDLLQLKEAKNISLFWIFMIMQ